MHVSFPEEQQFYCIQDPKQTFIFLASKLEVFSMTKAQSKATQAAFGSHMPVFLLNRRAKAVSSVSIRGFFKLRNSVRG